MSKWAGQPIPTPGRPWLGGPLGRGFATPVMRAQGDIFKGIVEASWLSALSWPCPLCRQSPWMGGTGTELGHMPRHHLPSGSLWGHLTGPALGNQNHPGCTWCPLAPTWKTLIAPKVAPAAAVSGAPPPLRAPSTVFSQAQWKPVPAAHPGLGTHGQDRTDNNKP